MIEMVRTVTTLQGNGAFPTRNGQRNDIMRGPRHVSGSRPTFLACVDVVSSKTCVIFGNQGGWTDGWVLIGYSFDFFLT